jgi:hypothetical protein
MCIDCNLHREHFQSKSLNVNKMPAVKYNDITIVMFRQIN